MYAMVQKLRRNFQIFGFIISFLACDAKNMLHIQGYIYN
jgi:hypothetical protein